MIGILAGLILSILGSGLFTYGVMTGTLFITVGFFTLVCGVVVLNCGVDELVRKQ